MNKRAYVFIQEATVCAKKISLRSLKSRNREGPFNKYVTLKGWEVSTVSVTAIVFLSLKSIVLALRRELGCQTPNFALRTS